MPLPYGIDLKLIKQGLLLVLEYGDNLPPGSERPVLQALNVLTKKHLNETEARGVATRLSMTPASSLSWHDMTEAERRTLRQAYSNAGEHRFRTS